MKKMALVLGLMALGAFSFAQDFKVSVGGGLSYKYDFANTDIVTDTNKGYSKLNDSRISFGVFGDFTYALVQVEYSMTVSNTSSELYTELFGTTKSDNESNIKDLVLSIYGKYPFNLSKEFSLFPLVGLGYTSNLDTKDKNSLSQAQKDDLNYLFLGAGLGCDFDLMPNLFVRFVGILNFAPNYLKKTWEEALSGAPGLKVTSNGFEIKAGLNVGYRF